MSFMVSLILVIVLIIILPPLIVWQREDNYTEIHVYMYVYNHVLLIIDVCKLDLIWKKIVIVIILQRKKGNI